MNKNFEICLGYSTSGTTSGFRKVVFQTHNQLLTTEDAINEWMNTAEFDVELITTSFDNTYWFGRIRCLLARDAKIIFAPHPINPIKIAQILENEAVSGISCDTPLFLAISKFMDKKNKNVFKTLKYIKIASAPMIPNMSEISIQAVDTPEYFYNYGLTEAMRCCILLLSRR